MAAVEKSICVRSDLSGLERVRYFPRQLLKADDMRAEQDYFREKLRRHNRFMHGAGVVCGLEVMPDTSLGALGVKICPGYALDPWGEEIYVPEATPLDLAHCARGTGDSCQPQPVVQPASAEKRPMLVQIRFAECRARPIRTLPAGCGCDDTGCEYSRIRDSFEIRCVLKPTTTTASPADSDLPACMMCPQEPWLLLAEITLDINAVLGIKNSVRTVLQGAVVPATS